LRRQAHRDRLDVLVTMLTFSNLVGIAGLRLFPRSPVPVAITEHGMTTAEALARGAGFAARARHRLARLLYRRSDAAIAVSHPVAADLVGSLGIDAARAFVVPNPVLRSSDEPPGSLPETLNVAFVGRLAVEKRPLLFVDTLAVLAGRGLTVRGTVLGRGPLLQEVRARGEAGGVALDFRGWREPWWEAAADVDCLLVTSSFEGFGNVCVEAAAARIPSVACSTALGVGDAVVPGLTGSLVAGPEPEQLADGVLDAVRSRDVDPVRGWLGRFSVETSTALLLEVLAGVARRGVG
jgi:glycosyltransferase involved in cell wall biosynthesis